MPDYSSREMLASSFLNLTRELDRQQSEELVRPTVRRKSESARRPTPMPDTFVGGSSRPPSRAPSTRNTDALPAPHELKSPNRPESAMSALLPDQPMDWQDVLLDDLNAPTQLAVVFHTLNLLREKGDVLATQLYLVMVAPAMMQQCDRVNVLRARRRVHEAAQEGRGMVDEERDTVSVPSLRLWSASVRRSSDNAQRRSMETESSSRSASPVDSIPEMPSERQVAGRMRRMWRGFCRFLDAGPPAHAPRQ